MPEKLYAGHPDQFNPPVGLPDPARVAKEEQPYERRVPSGIKPQWKTVTWRDYKARYFPSEEPTLLDRMWGTNEAAKAKQILHPCVKVSRQIHKCLDEHQDDVHYCRSTMNVLDRCFKEYPQDFTSRRDFGPWKW